MTIHTLRQTIASIISKGSFTKDHLINTAFKTEHGFNSTHILHAGDFLSTLHIDKNVLLIVLEDNQTSVRLHILGEGNANNGVGGQLDTVGSRGDEVNVRLGDIYT